jgi:hypothetical protein
LRLGARGVELNFFLGSLEQGKPKMLDSKPQISSSRRKKIKKGIGSKEKDDLESLFFLCRQLGRKVSAGNSGV